MNTITDKNEVKKWEEVKKIQEDWINRLVDQNSLDYQMIRSAVVIAGTCVGFLSNEVIKDTTNAIESLNSTYRKLNRQRSVFPSDTALLKALYLATFEATKKWTATIRNWAQVYGELSIMYEGRLPE